MELTIEHVIGANKAVQEVSADADTLRNKDKLEQIVKRINHMLERKEDSISILAYILHSIPTEQPFSNGNHRTATYLFYEYCYHFKMQYLGEALFNKR
ncbi:MAG: Fic family protein [Candidatus Micrarchaeales archaeon]